MKILKLTRTHSPGGATTRLLGRFDIELSAEIRIYNMRLLEHSSGRKLSYASSTGGQRNATFAPLLANRITAAAVAALEGRDTHHASAD